MAGQEQVDIQPLCPHLRHSAVTQSWYVVLWSWNVPGINILKKRKIHPIHRWLLIDRPLFKESQVLYFLILFLKKTEELPFGMSTFGFCCASFGASCRSMVVDVHHFSSRRMEIMVHQSMVDPQSFSSGAPTWAGPIISLNLRTAIHDWFDKGLPLPLSSSLNDLFFCGKLNSVQVDLSASRDILASRIGDRVIY